jgi:DNA-binding response OmpR family regulator
MFAKKKILLIDDEKDFCFFVKKNLEKMGSSSVIYTTNPDQGIRFARRKSPDLILLDIMMPKKDGFKVLEVLKKNAKTISIPVVMLTARGDDEAKLMASQHFGEEYITKPVSYEALETKIDNILRRWGRL